MIYSRAEPINSSIVANAIFNEQIQQKFTHLKQDQKHYFGVKVTTTLCLLKVSNIQFFVCLQKLCKALKHLKFELQIFKNRERPVARFR